MRGILVGAIAVLLAATSSTAAPIDYFGQSRGITAAACGGTCVVDAKTTMALGPWSETATAVYSDTGGSATATTTQTSDLTDLQVSMSGMLAAGGVPLGYAGSSLSTLGISFLLASDSPYVSTMSTGGDTASAIQLSLNPSGMVIPFDPNSSGVHAAGSYSLSLQFNLNAGGRSASGTYTYGLTIIPEPSSAGLFLLGGLLLVATRRRATGLLGCL
ncbi:MAG: PEP-CTERM sorting domain-containing protein [Planctomycetes bacterium]|nr:PEP-CTERM sorting domain-containing protein [Planctomycetota bacterium]